VNYRPGGQQEIPRPRTWSAGGPAPWAALPPALRHLGLAEVTRRIHRRGPARPVHPEPAGSRHAAVLIALFDGGSGPEVVLTRRSLVLSNHRGEISFPGGRSDTGETARQTALREAWEEVGLDPSTVAVVGELDQIHTVITHSVITPVVGVLGTPPRLRAATAEVDRVFTVPLDEFLRDDTFHAESWGPEPLERTMYFFELDDETVWGATARLLLQLLEVALGLDRAAGAA
jgi:8-oxo-dGTP pyrophosphatase MutT (NUDIX family)